MLKKLILILVLVLGGKSMVSAQINAERVLLMGRNALYYEDYVLSIQRFNMVINAKPHLAEPYFFRGLAKFYLEDYSGAEADCSQAISRNPYAHNYYVLRGLCRINLGHYDTAEADYRKAVEINPFDDGYWHNLVLCQLQQDGFERADSCLDIMIRRWPKEGENYTLKAQVKMGEKDTVTAEKWLDKALQVDQYESSALNMKAMLLLQRNQFADGEAMLDRAIVQKPRQADLYINRALARYNQENLRGAMSDYDAALELNSKSFVAHMNRALLRAQVGEDNLAIVDFNYVIDKEPDNYIAIYNRAILYNQTGQYRKAMQDLTTIINEYPQFWDGYAMRAAIRRKIGDVYGAERDEFKIMKARIEGVPKSKSKKKTRKESNHNLDEYDKLVETDDQGQVQEYASEYRGRVQNHSTDLQPMPFFVLSYYQRPSSINRYLPFMQQVEDANRSHAFPNTLYITNNEATITEGMINNLFAEISQLGEQLDRTEQTTGKSAQRLTRALDYYHVRDFESGLTDLDSILAQQPKNALALFMRAQMRSALLMANHPELSQKTDSQPLSPSTEVRINISKCIEDLQSLVELDSKQPYAYYNMGNMHFLLRDYDLAIKAYDRALTIDVALSDAYYNRGIAYLLSGQTEKGLADLSQAGEYGLYSAYNLIKKYSKK